MSPIQDRPPNSGGGTGGGANGGDSATGWSNPFANPRIPRETSSLQGGPASDGRQSKGRQSAMRQFFITVAAVLTALLLAIFIVPFVLIGIFASSVTPDVEPLPERKVLMLDLREPIFQQPAPAFFAFAGEAAPLNLKGLHESLLAAADDKSVAGLYIRGGDGLVSATMAGEIIEALAPFKAAGKPVYGFAQDIVPQALGDYQVLAQADTITMQPTGSFMPAGLTARFAYAREALDEIGVTPEKVAYREYKGAFDTFTETEMSPPQREANQRLVDVLYDAMAQSIAEARDFAPADLDAALERAPFGAPEAVKAGLADRLAYERELEIQMLDEAGSDSDLVRLGAYAHSLTDGPLSDEGPVIAVVYGEGPIMPGESQPLSPFGGEPVIGSDTMAAAILEASEDVNVKAILVRINSPGGSASASDQVWDAIRAAQANGTPVIASMGEVAASGGYYIPAGADMIIAHPTTVTGSIGVIGGKFSIGGLLDKVGVNIDAVSTTQNADIWANDTRFTEAQRARFAAWLGGAYEDFKDRVATGRDLTAEQTEALAKGRIWAGLDAREKGLVDRLGGLGTAVAAARELAELEADASVQLRTFPRPRTLQEEIFGIALNADSAARALTLLSALAEHPDIAAVLGEMAAGSADGAQARARVPQLQ
ncbi:signal peptide peptidase SppA [Pyruvatibacter mobilis]|uniref:signal peptide peptidase SppA n=1 Tax=Pyruvatibacter mobilis TaxID=1712261 RepID=UPI003C79CA8C